jgi:hypothetical protein
MAAPTVQNQSPAPSSTGNRGDGTVYLEVIDTDGDLEPTTVQIWANERPAWESAAAKTGFSGSRGSVTNGYSYTVTPDTPLPVGTVTMRVRAVDALGNVLDTTYTFDTAMFLDSIVPAIATEQGGTTLILTGLFPIDTGLAVTLAGIPCYGGPDKGYSPSSDDGTTLMVATPPMTVGGSQTLEVTHGAQVDSDSITIVERSWATKTFRIRTMIDRWKETGGRQFWLEDRIEL